MNLVAKLTQIIREKKNTVQKATYLALMWSKQKK